MSAQKINQLYPLGAYMINELGMEISKEKLQDLFKSLDTQFDPKIAELFCLSQEKIQEIESSVTSAPVAVSAAPAASGAGKKDEAPAKEEAAPAEEIDLFGDDLFD